MNRTTTIAHRASVALMGLGVLVATLDGFLQSYAGLRHWAREQHLHGWKENTFPLLVDLFVLVGEIGLLVLSLEGFRLTRKGLAWLDMALPFGLAAGGWGVSLAFNVGAVHGTSEQITAAVAPVASMLGLLVLLRTVHRLILRTEQDQAHVRASVGAPIDDEGAANGYALWETLEDAPALDSGPVVTPDPLEDWYDEPARWERWPLPELPATGGRTVDQVAEQGTVRDDSDTGSGREISHPDSGGHAGQMPPVDLASAVKSARAAGMSKRSIADEFGLTRYRVDQLLDEQPQPVAAVNGHAVAE